MPFQVLTLADLPATPWRNGGGVTRELACGPPGATLADFDWRLSLATVAADGDFSSFPGVDRVIALMEGAGMVLRAPDGGFEHRLDRPHAPFTFPGEAGLRATLIDGPCQDFNVMTRRGRWRAAVSRVSEPLEVAPAAAGAIVCVRGSLRAGAVELAPSSALVWSDEARGWTLKPAASDAAALLVRLDRITEVSR